MHLQSLHFGGEGCDQDLARSNCNPPDASQLGREISHAFPFLMDRTVSSGEILACSRISFVILVRRSAEIHAKQACEGLPYAATAPSVTLPRDHRQQFPSFDMQFLLVQKLQL